MSCSESPKPAFRLKLSPTLLAQLLVVDVKPDEFIEFVATQFHNIVASKPNCRLFSQPDKPVWILRGYYPNTPVFFKLTVVKAQSFQHHAGHQYEEQFTYYVRARELKVNTRKKWNETLHMSYGEIVVMSDVIMKNISESLENSLLGAEHKSTAIIKGGPTKPKCMSPKGMKLFRYKKPSKRRVRET